MSVRPRLLAASVLTLASAGVAIAQEPPPAVEIVTPAPAPKAKPTFKVVWDKGTVFATDDDAFEIKLTGRLHTRYEFIKIEDNDDTISRFLIVRARLNLEGHLWGKDNTSFKAEFSFSEKGNPFMKDFIVDKTLAHGLKFRIGQWKKAFNRQEITSDYSQQLTERAIDAEFASGGRDIGIALHNGYDSSPDGIEWVFAVMNGTSEKTTQKATTTCTAPMTPTSPPTCTTTVGTQSNQPADWHPLLVARVGWNSGGIKGYSETDLEGGGLRWAAAVSYRMDMNGSSDSSDFSHGVEGDFIVKLNGFDASGALMYLKDAHEDGDLGLHLQAGHFVIEKKLNVFGRFAMVPRGTDERTLEIRGGATWCFFGQNLKWTTDAGAVSGTGDDGITEIQVRSQAQLIF